MNDLFAILIFVAALLATFAFVQLCEWLIPAAHGDRAAAAGRGAPADRGAHRFWEPRQ